MIKINLVTDSHHFPEKYLRQLPGRKGVWGDAHFYINESLGDFDWWVICGSAALIEKKTVRCDPSHVVYLSMEPKEYSAPEFYNQFAKVITVDRSIIHKNALRRNGLTWWAGLQVHFDHGHKFSHNVIEDYDSFTAMSLPEKVDRISVVTSDKAIFPGHIKRLDFLKRIKDHKIGDLIDVYGSGYAPVSDKMDVIKNYKYHLVMENSIVPGYWTEKLADSFLGFAMPIYYGCPDVDRYFPEKSLLSIDVDNFDVSVERIASAIRFNLYDSCLRDVLIARNFVLNRHNIFNLISDVCREKASFITDCNVCPPSEFHHSVLRKVISKIKVLRRLM